ncbi:MAG: 3-hydroxyacyl-CoA dehydrogenase NAD-binding domain-containing protein [bacterium]
MPLKRIFIAGAGMIGQGIAEVAASSGIEVVLSDIDESRLSAGLTGVEASLDASIERWGITSGEKRSILSRIRTVVGIEEVEDCEFAIEAVPEKLNVKMALFRQFEESFAPETIFVTTTSTLSITRIAGETARPEKVVGMHFLHPVPKRGVVEVVRALKTSDETLAAAVGLATEMKKQVVEVYEYPGFVTTRVIIPFINEAAYALMEGVASVEGIDTAMKLGFDFPVGPLELADSIGLDELIQRMEGMFHELGDFKYRPCPLLRKMVRERKLGRKTGEGFYKYPDAGEGKR